MKTLRERILEGLASLRQSAPQMTADEQAELARVEAAAKGETTDTKTEVEKVKESAPAATDIAKQASDVSLLMQTVQAQSTQIATLTNQIATQQATQQLDKDTVRVNSLVRQMKMTPAEAEGWKKLAQDNPAAFQAAFATQEARPVLPQIRGASVKAQTEMSGDPGAELSRLAAARAKDNKISLGEAAKQIASERPDLAMAHSTSAPSFVVGGEGN